jgi:non-ribosomal peptide synthetase component F
MNEQERHQILVEWNRTERAYPRDKCIHQLFEEQAQRSPETVALVFEEESLTYQKLNTQADQLAHHLRSLGVGPDVLVALCVERSLEMVVALLGILKAGGAYVPLDPDYPRERLGFMLADSSAPLLVIQRRLLDRLPNLSGRILLLDEVDSLKGCEHETVAPLKSDAARNSLAYMIYTSGSTGKPKGALNEHGAIVNRLQWMQEEFSLTACDAVLQKTPFSFDVSVWEFFWPLMFGARLLVAKPGGHQDPDYLVKVMEKEGVTTAHFVPSMLQVFASKTHNRVNQKK